MKKLFLLIYYIVITLACQAQTNVYHPFPKGNAEWHQISEFVGDGPPFTINNYQYVQVRDTLINGVTYSKLYKLYPYDSALTHANYKGAIRQDTINKKVYFYGDSTVDFYGGIKAKNQEYLLYDFAVNIGDTIFHEPNHDPSMPIFQDEIVQKLDSVNVNGIWHKSYQSNNGDIKVEGIGSMHELLFNSFFDGLEVDFDFLCIKNTETGFNYENPKYNTCFLIAGIENLSGSNQKIDIHPIPANDFIAVSIPNSHSIFEKIEIYNTSGILMNVKISCNNGSHVTLDVSSLPNGIYCLKVLQNNKPSSSCKFVVNH